MAEVTLYDTGDPVKFCRKCRKNKPYREFKAYRDRRGRWCISSPCKECGQAYQRDPTIRARSRKTQKAYLLSDKGRRHIKNANAKKFGITIEDFEKMKDAQNNLCAICGLPETSRDHRTGAVRHLSIDHHHVSGRVRALLCNRCNTLIGLAHEDPVRLRSAAIYLEKHAVVS